MDVRCGGRKPLHRKRSPSPFRGAGTRSVTEGLFPAEFIAHQHNTPSSRGNVKKNFYHYYETFPAPIHARNRGKSGSSYVALPVICCKTAD